MDADELFEAIASGLLRESAVTESRMFEGRVLKVRGKVFAMLVKGALVVKLPAGRVGQLLTAGQGQPFDPGHGRVMKEWVAIPLARGQIWTTLAEEARAFVAAGSSPRTQRPRSRRRRG